MEKQIGQISDQVIEDINYGNKTDDSAAVQDVYVAASQTILVDDNFIIEKELILQSPKQDNANTTVESKQHAEGSIKLRKSPMLENKITKIEAPQVFVSSVIESKKSIDAKKELQISAEEAGASHSQMESPDAILRSEMEQSKFLLEKQMNCLNNDHFTKYTSTQDMMGRISEETDYHKKINAQQQQIKDMVSKRESSQSIVSVTIDLIQKSNQHDLSKAVSPNQSLVITHETELKQRYLTWSGLRANTMNQQSSRVIERNQKESMKRAQVARKSKPSQQQNSPKKNSAFKVSPIKASTTSVSTQSDVLKATLQGRGQQEQQKRMYMQVQVTDHSQKTKKAQRQVQGAPSDSESIQHLGSQQAIRVNQYDNASSIRSTQNGVEATTSQQGPSQPQIFSKAEQFGTNDSKIDRKLNNLGNLLHNYGGLNGMKDEFAQMLYSSSSKVFLSKNGSEIFDDKVRMNRQQKDFLQSSIEQQLIEEITSKEIKARKERATLEIFDLQNSQNQIIEQPLNENQLTKQRSQEQIQQTIYPMSPVQRKALLQQTSQSSFRAYNATDVPKSRSPSKVNVDTLVYLKVQDAKVAPHFAPQTLIEKHGNGTPQRNHNLSKLMESQQSGNITQLSLNNKQKDQRKQSLQVQQTIQRFNSPLNLKTLQMNDGERNQKKMAMTMIHNTPDRMSHKYLINVVDASTSKSDDQPSVFEGNSLAEEVGEPPLAVQSNEKLKIDLSVVSFLKPHIIRSDIYQLAHQGFTKDKLRKSDFIKSMEQQKRFQQLRGTYHEKICRNQTQHNRTSYNNEMNQSGVGLRIGSPKQNIHQNHSPVHASLNGPVDQKHQNNVFEAFQNQSSGPQYKKNMMNSSVYKSNNGWENDSRMKQVLQKYKLNQMHQSVDAKNKMLVSPRFESPRQQPFNMTNSYNMVQYQQCVSNDSRAMTRLPDLRASTQVTFPLDDAMKTNRKEIMYRQSQASNLQQKDPSQANTLRQSVTSFYNNAVEPNNNPNNLTRKDTFRQRDESLQHLAELSHGIRNEIVVSNISRRVSNINSPNHHKHNVQGRNFNTRNGNKSNKMVQIEEHSDSVVINRNQKNITTNDEFSTSQQTNIQPENSDYQTEQDFQQDKKVLKGLIANKVQNRQNHVKKGLQQEGALQNVAIKTDKQRESPNVNPFNSNMYNIARNFDNPNPKKFKLLQTTQFSLPMQSNIVNNSPSIKLNQMQVFTQRPIKESIITAETYRGSSMLMHKTMRNNSPTSLQKKSTFNSRTIKSPQSSMYDESRMGKFNKVSQQPVQLQKEAAVTKVVRHVPTQSNKVQIQARTINTDDDLPQSPKSQQLNNTNLHQRSQKRINVVQLSIQTGKDRHRQAAISKEGIVSKNTVASASGVASQHHRQHLNNRHSMINNNTVGGVGGRNNFDIVDVSDLPSIISPLSPGNDSSVIIGRSAKMAAQDTIFGKFNDANSPTLTNGTIIEETITVGKKKLNGPVRQLKQQQQQQSQKRSFPRDHALSTTTENMVVLKSKAISDEFSILGSNYGL